MRPHRRLQSLDPYHLAPGLEARLECDDTRLRQRQLDGLQDLFGCYA
jgi:hypothetical protein